MPGLPIPRMEGTHYTGGVQLWRGQTCRTRFYRASAGDGQSASRIAGVGPQEIMGFLRAAEADRCAIAPGFGSTTTPCLTGKPKGSDGTFLRWRRNWNFSPTPLRPVWIQDAIAKKGPKTFTMASRSALLAGRRVSSTATPWCALDPLPGFKLCSTNFSNSNLLHSPVFLLVRSQPPVLLCRWRPTYGRIQSFNQDERTVGKGPAWG